MATVVDYQYIPEISTQEALQNMTSDMTTWYDTEIPWVNTFKINAQVSTYNFPEWWGWDGSVAWWNTDMTWSAWTGSISWSSWNLNLPDWTQVPISSGSTSVSTYTYIYVDTTDWTVNTSTSALDAVWENKIMLCVAFPNSWKHVTYKAFGSPYQNSLTTGSDIANWTITTGLIQSEAITTNLIAADAVTANEIASNSIAATHIKSWAITTSKIEAWAVTAGKIDVSELSAIVAKLGDVYVWDKDSWSAIRIYPYSSSVGRIDFYYNWDVIWYMRWQSVSWLWGVVSINWDYIYFSGTAYCGGKLRIPVWTDLYN